MQAKKLKVQKRLAPERVGHYDGKKRSWDYTNFQVRVGESQLRGRVQEEKRNWGAV